MYLLGLGRLRQGRTISAGLSPSGARGTKQWGPPGNAAEKRASAPCSREKAQLGLYREWYNLSVSGTQFMYEIALFCIILFLSRNGAHPSTC